MDPKPPRQPDPAPVWNPDSADWDQGPAVRGVDSAHEPVPSDSSPGGPDRPRDPGRRRLIVRGLGLVGGVALAGGLARYLLDRLTSAGTAGSVTPSGSTGGAGGGPLEATPTAPPAPLITLPPAAATVAPLAADQQLSAPELTPLVIPNDQFYRVDVASFPPQVDVSTWQLKVDGMVDHPQTYSYSDLLAMPLFEQYVTLACVSNPVGSDLIGNALWKGVRLKSILEAAGVQSGASQIVGRSVDAFTVGFPTSWALDPNREPMIALGMNGQPLPPEHGYPARLIVPGLYGYVSATKWLSEIELTTLDAFNAFWVVEGWDKYGPILTESRIDHPGFGESIPAGPTWVDGLAWAPDRGISRVEGRVDGGAWNQAEMSRAISKATWVQWMWLWQATTGTHTVEVRATDGTGAVQTDQQVSAGPGGATGYHSLRVKVT